MLQIANSDSNCVKNRVADSSGYARRTKFTDSFGAKGPEISVELVDEPDVDCRRNIGIDGQRHAGEVLGEPSAVKVSEPQPPVEAYFLTEGVPVTLLRPWRSFVLKPLRTHTAGTRSALYSRCCGLIPSRFEIIARKKHTC
jgi:hypothetical protein